MDTLKRLNWRQVIIGAAVGYLVAQGVPPDKAMEAVTALANMLMPVGP